MIDLDDLKNFKTNELIEQCLKTNNKYDIFEILSLVETRKRLSDLTLIKKLVNHVIYLEDNIPPKNNARKDPPPWPWPITEPPKSSGGDFTGEFRDFSLLKYCGYTVGKIKGMSEEERIKFLDYFFTHELPGPHELTVDYGEPGSEVRLKKMANVMSSNCRNFKANDKLKYAYAINDYETDLKYLKNKYFIRGSFPWPESQ